MLVVPLGPDGLDSDHNIKANLHGRELGTHLVHLHAFAGLVHAAYLDVVVIVKSIRLLILSHTQCPSWY